MQQQQQSRPRSATTRASSFSLPKSTLSASPALTTSPTGATKPAATQRTSKTHQRLVELPSDPQTRPHRVQDGEDDAIHGYETDTGVHMREHKSATERMTKAERRRAGCRRITAYWLADGFRFKLLGNFLRREHNVIPRSFDEALYVVRATCPLPILRATTDRTGGNGHQMYHLPLLPGYGPAAKVRSSVPAASHTRRLSRMSQAEEDGYTGSYFIPGRSPEQGFSHDGYIARSLTSSPPIDRRRLREPEEGEIERESPERGLLVDTPVLAQAATLVPPAPVSEPRTPVVSSDDTAEIVFFAYGVAVFFGFDEMQERDILEDVHSAGTLKGARAESEWEVEECHFAVRRFPPFLVPHLIQTLS